MTKQRFAWAFAALAITTAAVAADEPLYTDPTLGTQLTAAQIKSDLPGNSAVIDGEKGKTTFYFGADGTLRQQDASGAKMTTHWRTRDYDNLFCFDTAGPCVQLLKNADKVTVRRKDGVVEVTAQVVPGNPANL